MSVLVVLSIENVRRNRGISVKNTWVYVHTSFLATTKWRSTSQPVNHSTCVCGGVLFVCNRIGTRKHTHKKKKTKGTSFKTQEAKSEKKHMGKSMETVTWCQVNSSFFKNQYQSMGLLVEGKVCTGNHYYHYFSNKYRVVL